MTPDSIEFDRPDLGAVVNGNPVTATAPSPAGVLGGTGTLHAIFHGVEATATLTVQASVVSTTAAGLSARPADRSSRSAAAAVSADGGIVPGGGGGTDGGSALPDRSGGEHRAAPLPLRSDDVPARDHRSAGHVERPGGGRRLPAALRREELRLRRLHHARRAPRSAAHRPGHLGHADRVERLAQEWRRPHQPSPSRAGITRRRRRTPARRRRGTWRSASLAGAIYYWTTSNGGSLSRIPPGAGATPVALTGPMNDQLHGLPRCQRRRHDADRRAQRRRASRRRSQTTHARGTSFDLTNPSVDRCRRRSGRHRPQAVERVPAGNVAVSPDGKYVLSGDKTLQLSDSTTGAQSSPTPRRSRSRPSTLHRVQDSRFRSQRHLGSRRRVGR